MQQLGCRRRAPHKLATGRARRSRPDVGRYIFVGRRLSCSARRRRSGWRTRMEEEQWADADLPVHHRGGGVDVGRPGDASSLRVAAASPGRCGGGLDAGRPSGGLRRKEAALVLALLSRRERRTEGRRLHGPLLLLGRWERRRLAATAMLVVAMRSHDKRGGTRAAWVKMLVGLAHQR
jgi:hypothetical protein